MVSETQPACNTDASSHGVSVMEDAKPSRHVRLIELRRLQQPYSHLRHIDWPRLNGVLDDVASALLDATNLQHVDMPDDPAEARKDAA